LAELINDEVVQQQQQTQQQQSSRNESTTSAHGIRHGPNHYGDKYYIGRHGGNNNYYGGNYGQWHKY
jgi:hypothetical protein